MLERRSKTARLLQLEALGDELESHLRVEEANNTEVIGRLVEDAEGVVVPRVTRPYVTERVLVLERIHGGSSTPATAFRRSEPWSWRARSSARTSAG